MVINAPRGNLPARIADEHLDAAFPEAASTCPVEAGIEVIAGRWKLLVLRSLFLGGAQRFNRLLHSIEGISAKELTRNLRELENAGLVERGATLTRHEGAEAYVLSELGQSLLPVFSEIGSFGERLKNSRVSRRSLGSALEEA
jgi:DNA-binding HxlR family transcriptional regulator